MSTPLVFIDTEAVGVTVPDGAEHTAMGDARTVAEIWDVVMAGGAS